MEFKIGDLVTYKDERYKGHYEVVSLDPNEYWLKSVNFDYVFLKYPPEQMTHYNEWLPQKNY